MQILAAPRQQGFTMVEVIIAMVITGIIAGMLAVFIARPVTGYIDSVRRAGLTDVADLALKRMALDIRTAVPNSVRVDATGYFIEYIPSRTGGRYCSSSEASGSCTPLALATNGASFSILSPAIEVVSGDYVVIFNTGQTGLDAYASSNNRCKVTSASAGASVTSITIDSTTACSFAYDSPGRRFQVVPNAGPVTFACENLGANGTLKRYTDYDGAQSSANFKTTQPTAPASLGTGYLLASNVSACRFSYSSIAARNGLLILSLTISRDGEAVTLHHEIHVDNMP
jgi:MSHA biogenesis protein MshO